jgi:hypothetical protein
MEYKETCEVILANFETAIDIKLPKIIPNIPPISVKITDSIKNCIKISFFFAPIAFLKPISFVLSVTEVNHHIHNPNATYN